MSKLDVVMAVALMNLDWMLLSLIKLLNIREAIAACLTECVCAVSCLQVLSCLVQIASVRRSLFNNAERAKFLSHLVDGVKRILENPQVRFLRMYVYTEFVWLKSEESSSHGRNPRKQLRLLFWRSMDDFGAHLLQGRSMSPVALEYRNHGTRSSDTS